MELSTDKDLGSSNMMKMEPSLYVAAQRKYGSWFTALAAAGVHLRSVTIHPFADGNSRMRRLLMNFVLHRHGFPLLNIPYEGRRSYYNALERSQVKENDSTFIQWFFRRYLKEHSAYAKVKK